MTWGSILLINIFTLIFITILVYKNKKKFFSFYNFFLIWYWIVMFMGIPLTYILSSNFNFLRINIELINQMQLYSIFFILIFIMVYKIPLKYPKIILFPKMNYKELQVLSFIFILLSSISILYFLSKNGLLILTSTSYEERYSSNLGLGILTRFFPFFIAGLVISFFLKPTYKRWKRNITLGIILGLLTYMVMGGYRQIIAIHIFVFLILGYHYSFIKLKTIIRIGVISIPLLMFMALFRYGINSSSELGFNFLIFTMDTFSPYDSFVKIIEYYNNHQEEKFQGFSIIVNEFSSLIPRAIWTSKPELVLNAGNFYTQEILKYNANVTISPTILGSLFLINGVFAIFFGALFLGLTLKWFDKKMYYTSIVSIREKGNFHNVLYSVFYYYILFYVPTIAREGIEVFFQRVVMAYIIFITFIFLSKIIIRKN